MEQILLLLTKELCEFIKTKGFKQIQPAKVLGEHLTHLILYTLKGFLRS